MPFIPESERQMIEQDGEQAATTPGQLCYIVYSELMRRWVMAPRWTTAHELYIEIGNGTLQHRVFGIGALDLSENMVVASQLAWQVFMAKVVMKYEDLKEKENGPINGV